ncbi:MAG TPA: hypothetical protein VK824_02720, partial [Planctomycetota bacterium]|nr:hypothetical protein [Planctomycetota bacterium]
MRIAGASERVVIMLLGLGAVGGASGQITPVQQAKIKASDASSKDSFGSSIAVWGDTAVVGAEHHDLSIESPLDEGAAYVFVRSDTAWTQQAQLVASDAAAADAFGHAVAVWGDTVAVGAWRDDHGGDADAGSVHVFVRNGTVWSEQAKLTAIDASMGDQFGRAVAMAGDTLVVGAPGDDPHGTTDAGSVHVFVRNGTAWKQQVRLAASDGAADDAFGCSVAVCDDTVVIGAVGSDPSDVFNAGAAYVFVRNGALWTEQAKLTTYHADAWDHLGVSVGVSGDTAVVGAKNADMHPAPDCGAACTYVRSGTTWTQQARLTASDATYSDGFGISVAVSGDTVVVGASEDDIGPTAKDAGSAYVFVRGASGWMEQAHLIAHNSMEGDRFGAAIAVWGDTALVGGP